jgi:ATP-dependent DNA ligase
MATFPTLYKKNRNGKTRKWDITVSSSGESSYEIVTIFGDIENINSIEYKKQTHTRVIDKGKSNRTILQQAILEAKSKWNEKKDRETYSETINTCEIQTNFRPMLASTFNASLYSVNNTSRAFKLTFPVLVQPKLDGIRCVSSKVEDGKFAMKSRKGVEIKNFENIKKELKMLYSYVDSHKDLIFDGELFTKSLNFETISGIVRQENSNSENKHLIEYHIYDVYDPNNTECPFIERSSFLNNLFKSVTLKTIKLVDTRYSGNLNETVDFHQQFVNEGFEGVIIRQENGVYEENKRSKFLQKHKSFIEEEFEIEGFHDGEGHDKDMVIWECKTDCGKKFSVKPRGAFKERRDMFLNADSYIGKKLTVIFQEYSADGIPRFPVGKSVRDMSY